MLKILLSLSLATLFIGCSVNNPQVAEKKQKIDKISIKEPNFNSGVEFQENKMTTEELLQGEEVAEKSNSELSELENSIPNDKLEDIGITKIDTLDEKKDNLSLNNLFYKISFDFNSYSLNDNQKEKLKTLLVFLRKNEDALSNKEIVIEGNADQRGTDEYNYALGIKRAHYIKEQILFNTSVLNNNIKIISYGESNPVCTQDTNDCFSRNRRVEISFIPSK